MAFPSDQGLGILDGYNNTLISSRRPAQQYGALRANLAFEDGKSRNIVVNLWDWNQAPALTTGRLASWATSKPPRTRVARGLGFKLGNQDMF